jgi:hypothetical protein
MTRIGSLLYGLALVVGLATRADAAPMRIAPADSAQLNPVIVPDGAGGAYVAWEDDRRGRGTTWMQRLGPDARSSADWPLLGVEALDHLGQTLPVLLEDGTGSGVYVASGGDDWFHSDPKVSVSLARVRADGSPAPGWPGGGIRIFDTTVEWPGQTVEEPLGVSGIGRVTLFPTLARAAGDDVLMAYGYMPFRGDLNLRVGRMAGLEAGFVEPWPVSPCNGYNSRFPLACSDGAGGMYILSWNGVSQLLLNRFTADGTAHPAWPGCGTPVVAGLVGQRAPAIVADSNGGVFAVWQDERDPDVKRVYVQRFTPGALVSPGWPAGGLAVSPGRSEAGVVRRALGSDFTFSSVVGDRAGGLLVAWTDLRSGERDIYLQRITPLGTSAPGWPAGGLEVCAANGDQRGVSIVSDGAGGAFVAWEDARRGALRDIYAHHVRADGSFAPGWTVDGELIDEHFADQHSPVIAAGSGGEPIVAWVDLRHEAPAIYAARRVALDYRAVSGSRPGARPLGELDPDDLLGIELRTMPLGRPPAIRITIGGVGAAEASVHDIAGRELLRREFLPGEHTLVLDGLGIAPGVYFARLTRGENRAATRVVVWR